MLYSTARGPRTGRHQRGASVWSRKALMGAASPSSAVGLLSMWPAVLEGGRSALGGLPSGEEQWTGWESRRTGMPMAPSSCSWREGGRGGAGVGEGQAVLSSRAGGAACVWDPQSCVSRPGGARGVAAAPLPSGVPPTPLGAQAQDRCPSGRHSALPATSVQWGHGVPTLAGRPLPSPSRWSRAGHPADHSATSLLSAERF